MAQKIPQAMKTAWWDLYTAALTEGDKEKLKTRIEDAERAIAIRYSSLDPVQDAVESRRLAAATRGLSTLRHESELRPSAAPALIEEIMQIQN
jgi:hypothetical protein